MGPGPVVPAPTREVIALGAVGAVWQPILWGLLTGAVAGGVGVAIVLVGYYRRRLSDRDLALRDAEARSEELDLLEARLRELEDRVDFTERLQPPSPPD